ncbi:MAG: M23 family metallopeptidase, partial [Rubrobacter sp.]
FVGRGGDQKVRAAGGGKVYRMCGSGKGWVRVYHSNGLSTDYYHLWATAQYQNGREIGRGTVLGVTGEDASCGGAAYGRHVHFALLQGQNHTTVHNRIIGGWTFKVGSEAYRGYTQRGSTLRYPGSIIMNHGVS